MLSVSGVTAHYGRVQALHGVDLRVDAGELVALVGANGAGKTTLLRVISGVHPLSAGEISVGGARMNDLPAHDRVRLGVAHVPQGRRVFAPLTVHDNLRLGGYHGDSGVRDRLAAMYAIFPALAECRDRLAGTLSGGQQQMLAIARALMSGPRLLLLDEPSMGLAPLVVDEIFAAIDQRKRDGMTILLVEQNAYAALSAADRAYVIETGRIVAEDTGEALLGNPEVQRTYLGL